MGSRAALRQLPIHPGLVRYSMMGAVRRALAELRESGTTAAVRADMAGADEWNELLGLPEYFALEQRFVRGTGAAAPRPGDQLPACAGTTKLTPL